MWQSFSRREFLGTSTLAAAALAARPGRMHGAEPAAPRSPNDRWRMGCIGMRYQGSAITRAALAYGDVVAICDVDRHVREQARASFDSSAAIFEDYRDLLARQDVDVVLIGAPDHWHAKMAMDACRAGKDVYCEKPLTLTIDEGKRLCQVVRETGRVLQTGSWQRSDARFRLAVEMVQAGRLGKLQKVTVTMDKNRQGGPFAPMPVPKHLNWNLWQGQTPDRPYLAERSHYTFRWWYEYSGGEMTDTGAHHLDIAQWAIGEQAGGPIEIEGTAKYPTIENGYNVAVDYSARYRYANGVELEVFDSPRNARERNGILFQGDAGRIFVNRGTLAGKPVEALAGTPLERGDFRLYEHDNLARPEQTGKIDSIGVHLGNFYDCTRSRALPISDAFSQHRSASLCHLGNIAMRVGRKLTWDPQREQFVGEGAVEANPRQSREQRPGFEVV